MSTMWANTATTTDLKLKAKHHEQITPPMCSAMKSYIVCIVTGEWPFYSSYSSCLSVCFSCLFLKLKDYFHHTSKNSYQALCMSLTSAALFAHNCCCEKGKISSLNQLFGVFHLKTPHRGICYHIPLTVSKHF